MRRLQLCGTGGAYRSPFLPDHLLPFILRQCQRGIRFPEFFQVFNNKTGPGSVCRRKLRQSNIEQKKWLLPVIPKIENGNMSCMYAVKQGAVLMQDTSVHIHTKVGQRIQFGETDIRLIVLVTLFSNLSVNFFLIWIEAAR
jgi:hypothetical protein